jgi:hypothetical protein
LCSAKVRTGERFWFAQYLDGAYLSLTNKLCASVGVHLHRNLSKQQHAALLTESSDRILDSDMAL